MQNLGILLANLVPCVEMKSPHRLSYAIPLTLLLACSSGSTGTTPVTDASAENTSSMDTGPSTVACPPFGGCLCLGMQCSGNFGTCSDHHGYSVNCAAGPSCMCAVDGTVTKSVATDVCTGDVVAAANAACGWNLAAAEQDAAVDATQDAAPCASRGQPCNLPSDCCSGICSSSPGMGSACN
jgi:hypothetical protein